MSDNPHPDNEPLRWWEYLYIGVTGLFLAVWFGVIIYGILRWL